MRKELVVRGSLWRTASFVNQHGTLEAHYLHPFLIYAPSGDGHDTLRGSALRLAFGQDGRFRVERVPCEDWMGRFHLVPAKIGNDLRANSAYAHACEEREPGVIDIEDGSTWPVFKYVADFKILVIKPRCFPITLWAQLPICRKCRFHNVSICLFHTAFLFLMPLCFLLGNQICSGNPCPLESEPCLARNCFIHHLVVDSSHPLLIHGQDLTSLCDLFCRWNKNFINDGDLLWMDRSLAVKT